MSAELLPIIDFTKVKKKRRVKHDQKDEKEENQIKNDEEDLKDVIIFKKKDKKKGGKKGQKKDEDIIDENEKNGDEKFSYDFLLKRIYGLMKDNNTNSSSFGLKIPTIQINVGKDRACWMNLEKIANTLNRNIDDLFKYVLSELGIEGTKGGENQANFKSRVTQSNLQKVLTKYINDYVRCPNCKSFDTVIKRDQSARLQLLSCLNCKSEKSVQAIKQRANAGKKKK